MGGSLNIVRIRDRDRILAFLQRETPINIYAIGDLDDPYWPHTSWYAAEEGGEIRAVCFSYTQFLPHLLIALCESNEPQMRTLLREVLPQLSDRLYGHLSPDLENTVEDFYKIETKSAQYKMYLTNRSRLTEVDVSRVVGLGEDRGAELESLYAQAYGDTVEGDQVFDRSMLATGQYFGVREGERLVSAAGVCEWRRDNVPAGRLKS